MEPIASGYVLFAEAEKMGLHPQWLTSFGVFSIQINGKPQYLFDGRSILNNHMAAYLAANKYVTRSILEKENLPNIPYLLPASYDEAAAFLEEHRQIILKQTLGSSDRVYLIETAEQLLRRDLSATLLERYIKGSEFRYLILDGTAIAVHERRYSEALNTKENVSRISYPRSEWSSELVTTAINTATALGLRFAAVDYLIDKNGTAFILEVNSAPGIAWFHEPTEGPRVNVAKMLLEKTIQAVRK